MAEPARRSAAGPADPIWGDIRRHVAVAVKAAPAAYAAYLASGCDDTAPAAAMLDLVLGVIRHLDETLRRCDVGEVAIEAAITRAVAEDRESRPGRRLRAVT